MEKGDVCCCGEWEGEDCDGEVNEHELEDISPAAGNGGRAVFCRAGVGATNVKGGGEERLVYFNARAKLHLQNYLSERTDDNPALFISNFAPFGRLTINGVEKLIRRLGLSLQMPKVHPHKFRRTLATMAIDKGMPIEQVQRLLGHVRIDTKLRYAIVNQKNVKMAHKKYIG
ncbi:MAG: site-specific integrase [Bacteroidales bacterium]|nr:site-specific integrase [Bacteroidales bacterium]